MANEAEKALLLAERDSLMGELKAVNAKLTLLDERILACDATDKLTVPTKAEYDAVITPVVAPEPIE